jgi:hypothetical protein
MDPTTSTCVLVAGFYRDVDINNLDQNRESNPLPSVSAR